MRHGVDHRDLGKIWLFSECSQSEMRKVTKVFAEVSVPSSTLLVEEGQPGLLFFVVLAGRASVTRGRRTVSGLGPGEFFGELSLLDQEPRSASVTSVSDMTLLVLRQHQFQKLLRATPTLTIKLLRAMADRLRVSDALAYG
jgi:CRP/FNR family cyclic AMP-dependent transcriptional regulator